MEEKLDYNWENSRNDKIKTKIEIEFIRMKGFVNILCDSK